MIALYKIDSTTHPPLATMQTFNISSVLPQSSEIDSFSILFLQESAKTHFIQPGPVNHQDRSSYHFYYFWIKSSFYPLLFEHEGK